MTGQEVRETSRPSYGRGTSVGKAGHLPTLLRGRHTSIMRTLLSVGHTTFE